jgi:uncharacterized Zn finger protein (UPF0148 family)
MELSGQRECSACGTRWSYFETGEIICPSCGSPRSVGVDEPREHTAGTAELDLTPVREQVDERPLREVADEAADIAREYVAAVGFIDAGDLQPFHDTYLAAMELRRVASTFGRLMQPTDAETQYFFSLLRGADSGERPATADVPETFYPERGLAIAAGADVYLGDVRRLTDETDQSVDSLISTIRTHQKRIQALDGDVPPAEAEQLVRAIRDLSQYLRTGDEAALARGSERFESEST